MKRQGSTELPRFAVGALAIAGASAANAASVQITFTGSFISTTGGSNNLVADFGGDGTMDISGVFKNADAIRLYGGGWGVDEFAYASGDSSDGSFSASVGIGGSNDGTSDSDPVNVMKRALVEIQFTDSNIRGGASTTGYLDITASATQPGEKYVIVHRLIFDDATGGPFDYLSVDDAAFTEYTLSAVPEPGSNLALLALGAGGLTLRRRLKRAA
jgi:hypothetical protein